jgi:biotin-(acetyl-CoA carboxylase) ligase
MRDSTAEWRSRLEALLALGGLRSVSRVLVVEECRSTQDEAERLAEGRAGLLLVTRRQTQGRGRQGRSWHQNGQGVAATFVLDSRAFRASRTGDRGTGSRGTGFQAMEGRAEVGSLGQQDALAMGGGTQAGAMAWETGMLALAAGLAAAEAVQGALAGTNARVGLKWPNDVVAWSGPDRPDRPAKIAGCLIEQRGRLALVGIGINVRQRAEDFPPDLAGRCTSVAMLGGREDIIDVIGRLARALDAALALPPEALVEEWRRRDILAGTVRTLEHDGRRWTGRVESIDPLAHVRLTTPAGPIELPAASTTVVWE